MPNTFTRIETIIPSSPTNVVTFQNIPQTYTDLKLVVSGRVSGTSASQGFYIQFNGSGTGYTGTEIYANGTNISQTRYTGANAVLQVEIPNELNTASVFGSSEIYIPNYSSTVGFKSFLIQNVRENFSTSTAVYMQLRSGLWSNTSAITSMAIGSNITAPNWNGLSTFTLYGIKNS